MRWNAKLLYHGADPRCSLRTLLGGAPACFEMLPVKANVRGVSDCKSKRETLK